MAAAPHFSADGTSLAVIQRDGYAGEDVQDPSYPFCYFGIFSNNEAKMRNDGVVIFVNKLQIQ
jgi:hypothetical protein